MIDINKLEFKKFPGGELHLTDSWTKEGKYLRDTSVICRIQCTDDLMKLCLFIDAYKRFTGNKVSKLLLPYIPYARQDRVPNLGEALSIKVFTDIINSLNFDEVLVLDPHSDVCVALLNNIKIIPQWELFKNSIMEDMDLISPDSGALKKIYRLQDVLKERNIEVPVRVATKHRDTKTTKISHTTIEGKPKNKTAVVIDDICDSGNTVIELAKTIKPQYDKLIFMVTHGIFSHGLTELSKYYDRILCTNSWNGNLKSEGVLRVIEVGE